MLDTFDEFGPVPESSLFITATGGWCAPSQYLYELAKYEFVKK